MPEYITTKNLRYIIDEQNEDSIFFKDLHIEITNYIKTQESLKFINKDESALTLSIRKKMNDNLNIKIDHLKLHFIDTLLEKFELKMFISHIKIWNYYDSIDSYSEWFFQKSNEIFNQFVHRLQILIESHDRFYQKELITTKRKKKITYTHLFNSDGISFVTVNFNALSDIIIKAIYFNRGFHIDEMQLFKSNFKLRRWKFEELLTKTNKISLIRRKNICESEFKNIWYWKNHLGIEFPISTKPTILFYIQTLRKINTSISNRITTEAFYKPNTTNWHEIHPQSIKKCHNLLSGVMTNSSYNEFERLFLKQTGEINWIGNMKQLLYFTKCLKEIYVVSNNCLFMYRHCKLKNEKIIESNNYKSQLSKLKNEENFSNRNFLIKNAISYLA